MAEKPDGSCDDCERDAKPDSRAGMKSILVIAGTVVLMLAVYGVYTMVADAPREHEVYMDNDVKEFASYDEIESYVKDSALSGYGLYESTMAMDVGAMGLGAQMDEARGVQSKSSASGADDFSKTNVQVEGVDEADIVKSDGKYIYAVSPGKIVIVDAYPAEDAEIVSEIDFNGTVNEIFVNGDKLVVFGQKQAAADEIVPALTGDKEAAVEMEIAYKGSYTRYLPKTAVLVYDVSSKSAPALVNEIAIDGYYYDSRMIDEYVYVIANQPTYLTDDKGVMVPEIIADGKCAGGRCVSESFHDVFYFEGVPGDVFVTVAAVNLERTADVASKIILTNYAQNMYVSSKNIYITYVKWLSEVDYIDRIVEIIMPLVPADVGEEIEKVMELSVSKMTKMQAVGEIVEKYAQSLSEDERQDFIERMQGKMGELDAEIAKEREKTVVQKIAIDGGKIEFKANGEVAGNTLNQFSMDEYNGYFRIATTTSGMGGLNIAATRVAVAEVQGVAGAVMATEAVSVDASLEDDGEGMTDEKRMVMQPPVPPSRPESKNHVYVLDDDLEIAGRLDDLASGERIYSVRFMGDKVYMVTFRQVDPLFVIDLSVPESPRVLGYLKIPGVSDYLHPYDEGHIIGVGRDANDEGRMSGMKLSLFDVSDVANPQEISKYVIGDSGTSSDALYDHKAFLFSRDKNLLVIPVSEYSYSVSEDDRMRGRPSYWQGAYVFNVDLNSGIVLKGKIEHEMKDGGDEKEERYYYYYDYASQIRRSLYMGDVLYTVSQRMIKMNSIEDLDEVNEVELPFESLDYPSRIVY